MIDWILAKKLKDAGYPIKTKLLDVAPEGLYESWSLISVPDMTQLPTLSELIEACGDKFGGILVFKGITKEFKAFENMYLIAPKEGRSFHDFIRGNTGHGSTPEEAVANLWLAGLH